MDFEHLIEAKRIPAAPPPRNINTYLIMWAIS